MGEDLSGLQSGDALEKTHCKVPNEDGGEKLALLLVDPNERLQAEWLYPHAQMQVALLEIVEFWLEIIDGTGESFSNDCVLTVLELCGFCGNGDGLDDVLPPLVSGGLVFSQIDRSIAIEIVE